MDRKNSNGLLSTETRDSRKPIVLFPGMIGQVTIPLPNLDSFSRLKGLIARSDDEPSLKVLRQRLADIAGEEAIQLKERSDLALQAGNSDLATGLADAAFYDQEVALTNLRDR